MNQRIFGALPTLSMLLLALVAGPGAIAQQATEPPKDPAAPPESTEPAPESAREPVDLKWLDRLPKEDRAALDPLIGFAPPAFTSDLKWLGGEPLTWDHLRGKVVVIQSFTTGTTAGRKWPERVVKSLAQYKPKDLRIVALHTPDKADEAEAFLEKKPAPPEAAVIIDAKGEFCDALGVFKHPVNIVVDRHGAVRYAGLNPNGLEQAVATLIAEPFDASKQAKESESEGESAEAEKESDAKFPEITGKVAKAKDIRGQRAPEFFVDEWITSIPDAKDKVVVIDFWATWCGPCVAAIPHMNELATRFAGDVVCVGLSDEKPEKFQDGLKKARKDVDSFKYALALDPARKMYGAIQISAIPHCIVMSKDWVVRWQGHPASLTAATLEQIVKADAGGGGATSPSKSRRKRGWNS